MSILRLALGFNSNPWQFNILNPYPWHGFPFISNPLTYIGNAPVFLAVKALRTVKFGVEYFTDLEPVINRKKENNECVLLLYLAYKGTDIF